MNQKIKLAISTCPNDTFAFHALLNKKVDCRGLDFQIQLLDISQLNQGLMNGEYDVAKASFYAALILADRYCVLPSGSALGFGNGPLLLATAENSLPNDEQQLTLCPGKWTTANLLFRLFHRRTQVQHVVFSEIMPMLNHGEANFGVCIHEGRFTYLQSGLFLVEDLGKRWESETKCPLPLGGILANKDLPAETLSHIQSTILDSITYGLNHREETIPTMRKYAQEFDDDVLMKHVELYVNQWTLDLGAEGREALSKLNELAAKRELLNEASKLAVWDNG